MTPQSHAVRFAVLVTMSAIGMMLADRERKKYPIAVSVANLLVCMFTAGERPCLFCLFQYVYTFLHSAIF